MYDPERKMTCPKCGGEHRRAEMSFSHDCQGIPYRLVCWDCLRQIQDGPGYDGAYYTSADENIEEDY